MLLLGAGLEDLLRLLGDPDSYPEGTPDEHFGGLQSEQALFSMPVWAATLIWC